MAIHYNSGVGKLYEKESNNPLAEVKYQLIETDPTKYTRKLWWGEFTTIRQIKKLGNYILELEDSRKGECVISTNASDRKKLLTQYHYRFNGRGKLGRRSSLRG